MDERWKYREMLPLTMLVNGTKVYTLERIVENIVAASHSRLVGGNKLTENLIIRNP